MQLEKGYIYHIYNQGNNQRKIFFKRENYLFFIQKIEIYILPYADILAWCLMPNHFHLMVLIREEELIKKSEGFTQSETLTTRSFNDSIGIMLRSYTRAINKQKGLSGSLFRKETKAECINCFNGNTPSFISDKMTQSHLVTEKQYPQVCFNYIHQNPVKANLVKNETDWEFSSAKNYNNLKEGKLVNKEVAFEYINYDKSGFHSKRSPD